MAKTTTKAPAAKAPPAKPKIPAFWDIDNRVNQLVLLASPGEVLFTIRPKWKNAGGPLSFSANAKGLKTIARDLSRQGVDGTFVRCANAPKERRAYASPGEGRVAVYFNIVDKTAGKKAERHLRVALGVRQQARLLDALVKAGG